MTEANLLFIDLETTGLTAGHHDIIEIGAVLFDPRQLETLGTFERKVKMIYPSHADQYALQLNHYDEKAWEAEGVTLTRAMTELIKFGFPPNQRGRDVLMGGFNFTFDWAFLACAFKRISLVDPFHYHRLDVMSMAHLALPNLRRHTLRECAAHFGIVNEKAHSALSDAVTTCEIYKALRLYSGSLQPQSAPKESEYARP